MGAPGYQTYMNGDGLSTRITCMDTILLERTKHMNGAA